MTPIIEAVALSVTTLAPTNAAPHVDLASLEAEVIQFMGAGIGESGGPLSPIDRRLRLTSCPVPTEFSWYGRDRSSVLVRCPQPGSWRLFVPVSRTPASVESEAPAIERGDHISVSIDGKGYTLTRKGQALESGKVGDWIKVRFGDRNSEPVMAKVVRGGKAVIQP
ncbi:flagella basal body P-ring formation protein FlgA [Sphingomicrobium astaxanthinifaciens]|uniref:flagella basal body P-ring formation protein FlgA n=2 Tax=Sphingomicrobium astaxanthinifaciens TaxID=1227949 RepID=UPI00389A87B4